MDKINTDLQSQESCEEYDSKGFTKRKPFKDDRLEKLKQRMLDIAGWAVQLPEPDDEPHIELLLQRGRAFDATWFTYQGEPRRCHFNSAVFWVCTDWDIQLVTGFALDKAGIWRQHSWCCFEPEEGLFKQIETTAPRILYYGVILTEEESLDFHKSLDKVEMDMAFCAYEEQAGFKLDDLIEAGIVPAE